MNDEVKIISSTENWSEYKLEDGATMKLKPVVSKIVKTGNENKDGSPVFNIKFQLITDYEKND